jgi:hypothetical protein
MKEIFAKIGSTLGRLQVKRVAALLLVSLVLMTTSALAADLSPRIESKLNRLTQQGEGGRPRTTGQWEARNEELQGQPGKRIEQIGEQSAEAVGAMANIYPQNAKTLTPGVDNGELPKDD